MRELSSYGETPLGNAVRAGRVDIVSPLPASKAYSPGLHLLVYTAGR